MLDVQLGDDCFSKISFRRCSIPVDLSVELSKLHEKAVEQSNLDTRESAAMFSTFIKNGDRYISCMEQIKNSPEVWTGNSDGSIIIRHSGV